MASGYWGNYGGKSSASACVNPDGTVSLLEGSVDIGGSRAVIAMQLAETLGLSAGEIKPQVADTDAVGYTEGTYGSRTTFATGWAVYELGQELKRELIERAAHFWEVEPGQVAFTQGLFSTNSKKLTFKELAGRIDETGSAVMATATVLPETYGPGFSTKIFDSINRELAYKEEMERQEYEGKSIAGKIFSNAEQLLSFGGDVVMGGLSLPKIVSEKTKNSLQSNALQALKEGKNAKAAILQTIGWTS